MHSLLCKTSSTGPAYDTMIFFSAELLINGISCYNAVILAYLLESLLTGSGGC